MYRTEIEDILYERHRVVSSAHNIKLTVAREN